MISELYDWMKNIIIFMIFTTVIMNLLGKSNYRKYAGLVTGLILVLLVIGPILKLTGNSQYLDFSLDSYESLVDAKDLNYELFQMGEMSDTAILDGYRQVIVRQTELLLNENGLTIQKISLVIEEELTSSEFGKLLEITIVANYQTTDSIKDMNPKVEPVTIDRIRLDDSSNSTSRKEKKSLSAMEIVIKNRLADFYNLDSNNINITIQEDHDGERR